jgi:hypothetical protein
MGRDEGCKEGNVDEVGGVFNGTVGVVGGEGGSRNRMRRSTMTLALRKTTVGSLGLGSRCMGIDTRSRGPVGVVGELTEYRMVGA